jgi:hypothetical protein
MGNTITKDTSKGQLVTYIFAQDAVAASQTDVQLCLPGETTTPLVEGYEMAFPGEVIGLSYTLSAAGTAGTFTIGATVNGTEDTDTTVTVGTNTANYTVIPRGKCVFNASDSLGAEITTNGSWDGTTSDLVVVLYVLHYIDGV